jgi:hypothetical protein
MKIKIFLFYLLSSEIWSRGPVSDFMEREET